MTFKEEYQITEPSRKNENNQNNNQNNNNNVNEAGEIKNPLKMALIFNFSLTRLCLPNKLDF